MKQKILWVDDEIELLRSHIIYLTEKGYEISTVTNGEDALEEIKNNNFDIIFLDEMMPGMGGLKTLGYIKEISPNTPVVMVTKNEEESVMNEAIGSKISDFLIKPVVPSQLLLVLKKILDKKKISSEFVAKDYLNDFNQISVQLSQELNHREWTELYTRLVNWQLELDLHPDIGLQQTLEEQIKEANKEFSKFVERKYRRWISGSENEIPDLTPDIVRKFVFPHLNESAPTFLFVLDCLRYDQWLILEKHLAEFFNIKRDFYMSILPTATPYARNALFAGLFPSDIEKYYPDLYSGNSDDERSMNKYEKEMLQQLLNRHKIKLNNELKYMKIIDPDVGRAFEQNISSHRNTHFMAVVVNFLDMIAHGRSDSNILREIAPNESAYRSLTNSWFSHSSLLGTFKAIARMPNSKVIVTTDHGSIRTQRGAKVLSDKEASSNLRFKFGRNLKVDDKNAVFIKDASEYKLPKRGLSINYIIAKEDYYFVYPTEYHKYLTYYKDSFQHGGISMEEMILPIITMENKLK
ncbi:MAG: PglZ domain-containing protein [Ignavibacteriales bacterium CG_4_9_14_3_um_filter_34_10]|nr:MAG: PglZ domain-containing protein [Ignavibacteria bacterium CG08_land_8_20_14_0_20_37_9]PJA95973.1 MAG: PglZ domain-containing protein [Ignavibacteriales bacterium CG_4_9_14_3_um_filter_34_10]